MRPSKAKLAGSGTAVATKVGPKYAPCPTWSVVGWAPTVSELRPLPKVRSGLGTIDPGTWGLYAWPKNGLSQTMA